MAEEKKIQHYWDRYDIPRVPLSIALNYLDQTLRHGRKRGVITMIGDAGVGKTQGVHGLARQHGYRVVDFRTAQFTTLSAGVPQRAEGDHFKIAVPDSMPKEGEKALLLFDEINQGTPGALAMFFQLLEDRCLYNYKLPDDTVIVALMNPATSEYSVSRIESNSALNRRLKKFYVFSTYQEWAKHAQSPNFHFTDGMKKPCHPVVQRLLAASPTSLYDDKARGLGKQYPCPATWQTVSLDLYLQDADKIAITDDSTRDLIAATIGNHWANELVSFVRKDDTFLSAEEVLSGYTKASKIRKTVQASLKEGGGDVVRLQEEVPTLLMSSKPTPSEVAPRFALFLSDLTDASPSRAEALYNHLKYVGIDQAGADKDVNKAYIKRLNDHLKTDENYLQVHELLARLDAEFRNPGAKDPMYD